MTIVVGTNSYVSLQETESYFATRLDAAAWDEADEQLQKAALVTAAKSLDDYGWVGKIADPEQALAWPREGSYFDPRAGYVVELQGIPDRIKRAQMELAYHLLHNDGVLDEGASVEEVRVGPIAVKGISVASSANTLVNTIVGPLTVHKNSGGIWWRAN